MTTTDPLQLVLPQLRNVKESSNGWIAYCPAHDDTNPSLSIAVGDDGKVLLKCHADCAVEDIVAAIGLTMADLMPSGSGNQSNGRSAIAKTYNYDDADGNLVFQVVRTEPKGFFQRQRRKDGGWNNRVTGIEQVPYRLRELLASGPSESVYVVEGEKDVDSLAAIGIVATCNAGGAGKWKKSFAKYFKGRHVVIFADNDAPDRKHAQQVAQSLIGVAASVKIVELPGLDDKEDVYGELAQLAPYAVNVQVKISIRPAGGPRQPSDFRRLATLLKDAGYRGYIVLEHEEDEDRRATCPRYINELREAFA